MFSPGTTDFSETPVVYQAVTVLHCKGSGFATVQKSTVDGIDSLAPTDRS